MMSLLFQAAACDKFASTSLVMSVLCSTFSIVEFSLIQIHQDLRSPKLGRPKYSRILGNPGRSLGTTVRTGEFELDF